MEQGCQYNSIAFGLRCMQAGVRPSMGSVADGYDSAMSESFLAKLKCDLLERVHSEGAVYLVPRVDQRT